MKISRFFIAAIAFALVASVSASQASPKKKTYDVAKVLKVLDIARGEANDLLDGINKYKTLENVAIGYAQLKHYDLALEVATSIDSKVHKINALLWISRHYEVDGQRDVARFLLSHSLNEAFKMETSTYKVAVFEDIARVYLDFDLTDQSYGILAQAKTLEKILAPRPSSEN